MRDATSKWWRPVGFWALTINVSLGFPIMVTGVILWPDANWGILAGVYATILAAWAAAAGIRQWGKSNGSEK